MALQLPPLSAAGVGGQMLAHARALAELHAALARARAPSAPADGSRPTIPSVFSARCTSVMYIDGTPPITASMVAGDERLVQNTPKKRLAQKQDFKMPFSPKEFIGTPLEWVNSTMFNSEDFGGFELNGQFLDERKLGIFFDLLGWVNQAKVRLSCFRSRLWPSD